MKWLAIIFSFSCLAFALNGNFNGDCLVNFEDFAILATDWQQSDANIADPNTDIDDSNTVDLDDLYLFCQNWLEFESGYDGSPDTNNICPIIPRATAEYINLVASDIDSPLVYRITSLPAQGLLYDPNGTDPNHTDPNVLDPNIIAITSVPYTLTEHWVLYDANDTFYGDTSFGYDVNDGGSSPCGGVATDTACIHLTAIPVADSDTYNAYTHITTEIELIAADDGMPDPPSKLKYIVITLPTNGLLQDPASGAHFIDSNMLPYTIVNGDNTLWFWTDTNGTDSFTWKANDYGTDPNFEGDSTTATATLNVSVNPKDCLSFNGNGYIDLGDNAYYDLADGFAIDLWLKTYIPNAVIAKKIDANGLGWEFNLKTGKPQFELYDANGTRIAEARSVYRITAGEWNEVGFTFNHKSAYGIVVAMHTNQSIETWIFEDYNDIGVSYANDANLIIGYSSNEGYKHELDKIRFFNNFAYPTTFVDMMQGFSGRTESGNEVVLGFGRTSSVLYMLDEGTGTTITDDKASLTGTLTANDPNWLPFWLPFQDIAVQQYYYRR